MAKPFGSTQLQQVVATRDQLDKPLSSIKRCRFTQLKMLFQGHTANANELDRSP